MSEPEPDAEAPERSRVLSLPLIIPVTVCLAGGIAVGRCLSTSPLVTVLLAITWLVSASLLNRRNSPLAATVCVLVFLGCLGALRWQVFQSRPVRLRELARDGDSIVRLQCRVCSVPTLHNRPQPVVADRQRDLRQQTRFQVDTIAVDIDGRLIAIAERCHVYIEGNAATGLSVHDEIQLIGEVSWPKAAGNPGEFDFSNYLARHRVSALLFVRHPDAVRVLNRVSSWNPWRWICGLRSELHSIIVQNVDPGVQSTALALLLGERNQLPAETERAFIASGTMHLLAISGLHVGILCWFILRTCNILIVPRRRALWITLAICLAYALVTDLRPSVLRATLFFAVFAVCELTRRQCRFSVLVAVTALAMLSFQPALLFDAGAWLSFLSVTALGCVEAARVRDRGGNLVPEDAPGLISRLKIWLKEVRRVLFVRYRQMLAILALTTPLIAMMFHVVSPVGLLVNVVLIPLTAAVLCIGFVALVVGVLLPPLAAVPAQCFSVGLRFLQNVVEAGSDWGAGHLYIPDLPPAFVIAYYVLVSVVLISRNSTVRYLAALCVFVTTSATLAAMVTPHRTTGLTCTVIDIGHGSAAVVEFEDGKVLLVDAGALNNGERAAETICRFLWRHGYRALNGILVSHADADHYNAVPGILARMPVAELITSRELVMSESSAVQGLLKLVETHRVPIRLVEHRDEFQVARCRVRILKPELTDSDASDNEKSIVVDLSQAGFRMVLPGDVEGEGADKLMPDLGPADILVSPHHGSFTANGPKLQRAVKPRHLIVSARDAASARHLHRVFFAAESIRFTSDSGAVSVHVDPEGRFSIRESVSGYSE